MNQVVKIWEEEVIIPTYPVGEAEKNPMFLEKRVYQGGTGKVYPLPIIEKLSDEKVDKTYKAVFLENEYLHVMILPELGGRIQRAIDKTNNYDFVYYNQVIKPALVGLAGPWIAGGIEFNWPQHHRPSTFMPVEYLLVENTDGSKTCFVSEIDQMYGTKGMASFTLHPGKAYIEIKGQVYNPTEIPQTFLWWANPAIPANDYTQSIFPPDVHAVMDHGKRDVSRFPLATGTYYKVDYSEGVDISKYKNIPVPTSFMAYHSDYDFIGGYDHNLQAGILHIANHHISPGKKQWTWGCGDFGSAWERNLTDEDGPYIELMTGVFTDNQPDFTWLNPYEEKVFTQYFLPYKNVGVVKNATIDAAVNLEVDNDLVQIVCYGTSILENAQVVLTNKHDNTIVFKENFTLSPVAVFEKKLKVMGINETDLLLEVFNQKGELLVSYEAKEKQNKPVPDPASEALAPELIKTTEELYLTALHLEQYRHATYLPDDYYLEGLKRDKTDIRLNNGYGLLLYRRGLFSEALSFFEEAVKKATWKNPQPYDSEPLYNKGLALWKLGQKDEAYAAFYKATWSNFQQEGAFYSLACLACDKGDYQEALQFVSRSIVKNYHNLKARGLKASLLRYLKQNEKASKLIEESLEIDKLDHYSRFEAYKLDNKQETLELFQKLMRNSLNNYLVLSLNYAQAGLYLDALEVLNHCQVNSPLVDYYKAYFYTEIKQHKNVSICLNEAKEKDLSYAFPNKLTEVLILENAIKLNPDDYLAYYLIGNLWYDKLQVEKALTCWEKARDLMPSFPTVHRNLALVYYNKLKDERKAVSSLEKAFSLNPTDGRVLFELDQLYKILGKDHKERLDFLQKHYDVVIMRDDLYLEYCGLHNYLGEYETAYNLIMARIFHPWEGGEGKVPAQYKYALVAMAKKAISNQDFESAIDLLQKALVYPSNIGEGKLIVETDNNLYYYLGQAFKGLGDTLQATTYFEKATFSIGEIGASMFYNDQPADLLFYQGLAFMELGNIKQAKSIFNKLKDYGETQIFADVKIDYFAVSLPDFLIFDSDLNKKNQVHCNYLIGLGNLGLGNVLEAKVALDKAYEVDNNHQGVITHLQLLDKWRSL